MIPESSLRVGSVQFGSNAARNFRQRARHCNRLSRVGLLVDYLAFAIGVFGGGGTAVTEPAKLHELSEKDVMNVLDMIRREFNIDVCRAMSEEGQRLNSCFVGLLRLPAFRFRSKGNNSREDGMIDEVRCIFIEGVQT